jgi:hypothetical protein
MPRKRIANPRIVANSEDIALNASTFAAWGSVSNPRGLMHSAAAMIGETNRPVAGSVSIPPFASGASVIAAWPARRHWVSRRSS